MEHSSDQVAAIEMAIAAIFEKNEPCLIMGRAGTGKTTTLKGLVKEIKSRGASVQIVAFTNKAADVVRKKLHMDANEATTSHRLLYQTEMVMRIGRHEFKKKDGKIILDELAKSGFSAHAGIIFNMEAEDGCYQKEMNEIFEAYKKIDYSEEAKTSYIENPDKNRVIICDETSMLPYEDMQRIVDTYPRVVFVGDYRQLPPINSKDTIVELMASLDNQAELTKVFRSGDAVLELAERAEKGQSLGGTMIGTREFIKHVKGGSKFILSTNKDVFGANMAARRLTGKRGAPKAGEPLTVMRRCTGFIPSREQGSHELLLKLGSTMAGGQRAYDAWPCVDGTDKPDYDFERKRDVRNARIARMFRTMTSEEFAEVKFFVKKYVVFQKNVDLEQVGPARKYSENSEAHNIGLIPVKHFSGETAYVPTMNFWNMTYEMWDRSKKDGSLNVFFAYAITVHKSQGSEYDTVVYKPASWGTDVERRDYTAITRAKKECVIAKGFNLV